LLVLENAREGREAFPTRHFTGFRAGKPGFGFHEGEKELF
jgi:hypothetical protein